MQIGHGRSCAFFSLGVLKQPVEFKPVRGKQMPELPDGLPAQINEPSAWYGPELSARPDEWTFEFSAAETNELVSASDAFLSSGADIGVINSADFPLPQLATTLASFCDRLKSGIGFQLVKGLPVDELTPPQIATIFCGIGAHIGTLRSQNAQGHLLGHVRDVGADPQDNRARIYQTSARQTFHTDSSDAVALLCLKDAMAGGESLLASSATIYNEIARRAPDLLPYLFDAIATDRRGEQRADQAPFFTIPVFSWHAGRLTSIYQRQYIDSAQRYPDAPRLTEKHVAALDLFDSLADDPAIHMEMRLAPGDMQFVYNHALLHDRTGFRDWPDPADRRHLLRLWLSLPGDRPLPECFRQRYDDITIGARGGILLENTKLNVELW